MKMKGAMGAIVFFFCGIFVFFFLEAGNGKKHCHNTGTTTHPLDQYVEPWFGGRWALIFS